MPSDAEPGARLPGETAVAYEAFRTYLELGPKRSTAAAARALGKSKTLTDRWCARWHWVDRVREVESATAAKVDDALADERVAAAKRQAKEARVHAQAMTGVSAALLRRLNADPQLLDRLDSMTVRDLARVAVQASRGHHAAVQTERLALGMTTEQPGEAIDPAVDAAKLSDEDLLERLAGLDG